MEVVRRGRAPVRRHAKRARKHRLHQLPRPGDVLLECRPRAALGEATLAREGAALLGRDGLQGGGEAEVTRDGIALVARGASWGLVPGEPAVQERAEVDVAVVGEDLVIFSRNTRKEVGMFED